MANLNSSAFIEEYLNASKVLLNIDRSVTFFGSARLSQNNIYYHKAYNLAKSLANHNIAIVTGGSTGIMEAGNKGAFDAGGVSVGLNAHFANEQELNAYVNFSYTFKYINLRKQFLINLSNLYVFFPGGFGTLDELFECIIDIISVGKGSRRILLYDHKFWNSFIGYCKHDLIPNNLISQDDLNLIELIDDKTDIDELSDFIAKSIC